MYAFQDSARFALASGVWHFPALSGSLILHFAEQDLSQKRELLCRCADFFRNGSPHQAHSFRCRDRCISALEILRGDPPSGGEPGMIG